MSAVHRPARAAGVAALLLACALAASACRSTPDQGAVPAPSPSAPDKEAIVLSLSSPAFENGGLIPVEHATMAVSGGKNVSIPYEWAGVPEGTKSLALVLVDLYPGANSWVHWMVTSIPAQTSALSRGASGRAMPEGSVEHASTFGGTGYGGPQPPAGTGKHEYEATLYALDVEAPDAGSRTLGEFNASIDGHVLASASCTGLFGR